MAEETKDTSTDDNTDDTSTDPGSSNPNIVTITRPDGTTVEIGNTPENQGLIQSFGQQNASMSAGRAGEMQAAAAANPQLANEPLPDSPIGMAFSGQTDWRGKPTPGWVPPNQVGPPTTAQSPVSLPGQNTFGVMQADANPGRNNMGADPSLDMAGRSHTAQYMPGGNSGANGKPVPFEHEDSTTTKNASAETKKLIGEQRTGEAKVIASAQEAATAHYNVNASAANLQNEQNRQQLEDIHNFRQSVDTEVQHRLATYDAETKKLSEMKIDPHQAFGDGVTPSKILAGIGLAMGAIGQAHGGGPNMAIGIIQNAIKQDIEVQKANMEKQKGMVEAARGGLDAYIKVADSKQTAMALEQKRQNDYVLSTIKQMEAGIGNLDSKAAMDQLALGFTNDNLKLSAQITGSTTTSATKSMVPSMMGKTDAGVNKEITSSEGMGQRFHDAAAEIEKAKANKDVAGTGTFGKWLNGKERLVGQDDPRLTAFQEKVENLFVDQAVNSGLTRKEGLEKFEKITGKGNDSPDTLIQLLRQEGDKEANKGAQLRQAHAGQLRLPNPLPASQTNFTNIAGKRNTKVGH